MRPAVPPTTACCATTWKRVLEIGAEHESISLARHFVFPARAAAFSMPGSDLHHEPDSGGPFAAVFLFTFASHLRTGVETVGRIFRRERFPCIPAEPGRGSPRRFLCHAFRRPGGRSVQGWKVYPMTSLSLSSGTQRSELLASIDGRTKLAGTNKLEILLFSLGLDLRTGRHETFGINVFKVREVMHTPEITCAPEMHPSVEGMVSLRGVLVPVVDLVKYVGVESGKKPGIMIVTEYNQKVQGFLVDSVDTILRLDWSSMKVPPSMVNAQMGGLLTAVTELKDGRLIMMLDVEKILSETMDLDEERLYQGIEPVAEGSYTVFFADDSAVARKQIAHTLGALHVDYRSANNGLEAWNSLQQLASQAEAMKVPVQQLVNLVLTDVEMPEMDGYVLTRNIKSDGRFTGIPVLMYSSLSSVNEHLGRAMGVDEYVSKLQPHKLAEAVTRHLKPVSGGWFR